MLCCVWCLLLLCWVVVCCVCSRGCCCGVGGGGGVCWIYCGCVFIFWLSLAPMLNAADFFCCTHTHTQMQTQMYTESLTRLLTLAPTHHRHHNSTHRLVVFFVSQPTTSKTQQRSKTQHKNTQINGVQFCDAVVKNKHPPWYPPRNGEDLGVRVHNTLTEGSRGDLEPLIAGRGRCDFVFASAFCFCFCFFASAFAFAFACCAGLS